MWHTRQVIRALHTSISQLAKNRRARKANAGLAYQIEELEIRNEDEVVNDLGELESDFMHVHKTYGEYTHEQQQRRDEVRRFIIKHKYFREPHLPNMLTYAEKQQIHMLHENSPEEWSAEKLAESFPATPDIIKKLVRGKWRARDSERVLKHDTAVAQNWRKLKTDPAFAAQFPDELRAHLSKFTERTLTDIKATTYEQFARPALPQPHNKEFLSIITSCAKYEQKQISQNSPQKKPLESSPKPISNESQDAETYIFDKILDKRQMRLNELKQLKLKSTSSDEKNMEETYIKAPDDSSQSTFNNTMHFVKKFEENEIVISESDVQRFDIAPFKHRIHIPHKLRRKGSLYRVQDCYYDDDGEFLYSVPGMTGKFT